jgi:hypothetical protein
VRNTVFASTRASAHEALVFIALAITDVAPLPRRVRRAFLDRDRDGLIVSPLGLVWPHQRRYGNELGVVDELLDDHRVRIPDRAIVRVRRCGRGLVQGHVLGRCFDDR